jgi:sulfide:quinone oxidoreductase
MAKSGDVKIAPYGEWASPVSAESLAESGIGLADLRCVDGVLHWLESRPAEGGRMVVNVVENPIKCPVAPLEFLMLADAFFHERGIRDRVELVYATPLPGAFTKPIASKLLGGLLAEKGIQVEPEFYIERVDPDAKRILSYDERELGYDLLVSVPLNKGADVIGRSGLGDELNYVPVNKHTFLSDKYPNIFTLGDASNAPASKAGSVTHFAVDLFGDQLRKAAGG